MKRTRRFTSVILCILLALALAVPAAAHCCHGGRSRGHHGGRQWVQTVVSVCTLENCSIEGQHVHNGVLYCGYAHESGLCDNACCALCPLADCETPGRHVHGLSTYCGYHHEDGFCDGACRALCPYEDCDLTGRHVHSGESYCGYAHESDFCDGACAVAAPCGGCCHG